MMWDTLYICVINIAQIVELALLWKYKINYLLIDEIEFILESMVIDLYVLKYKNLEIISILHFYCDIVLKLPVFIKLFNTWKQEEIFDTLLLISKYNE